jgi:hypothetical protein
VVRRGSREGEVADKSPADRGASRILRERDTRFGAVAGWWGP